MVKSERSKFGRQYTVGSDTNLFYPL